MSEKSFIIIGGGIAGLSQQKDATRGEKML
jgi:glycerol-3-phosphate dehydrogenase